MSVFCCRIKGMLHSKVTDDGYICGPSSEHLQINPYLLAYILYGEAILMLWQVIHRMRCLASERLHKIVACKNEVFIVMQDMDC